MGSVPAFAGVCTAPVDLVKVSAPLPHLIAAVNAKQAIRIVALGSSSTAGTGASGPEHTYPARLELELRTNWPKGDVRVFNAGISGQLASDMVARIDHDVVPRKPQLVLWQTGGNDAIKGVALEDFTRQLRVGIERLRRAGFDVVLIDPQFYPAFAKVKDGARYLAAMRETAAFYRVPMMQRFAIMQHLIASAQFTTASLYSKDQFHLNDSSYDCMGHLLAQSLRSAATFSVAPAPPAAQPISVAPKPALAVSKDQARM